MDKSAIGPVVEISKGELERYQIFETAQFVVRISFNFDGVRFQIDYGTWSPPMGRWVAE